jgi:hypothetical protein
MRGAIDRSSRSPWVAVSTSAPAASKPKLTLDESSQCSSVDCSTMPKFVGHGDYAWPERLKDLNRPLKHADEEFQVAASGDCCEPGPQHIFLAPT